MEERKARAVKAANDILDFVNVYGFDSNTFAETICHAHRTLQQSVMSLFVTLIRYFSENGYDERNEATVELSKELVKITDKHSLPFI